MSRHRKELRGDLGHGLFGLCVKSSLLLSVSEWGVRKVKKHLFNVSTALSRSRSRPRCCKNFVLTWRAIHRRGHRAADRQRPGFLRLVFGGRRRRSPDRTCAAQNDPITLEEPHPVASVRFVRFHRSVRVFTENVCVICTNCNQCSCFANLGLNCLRPIY